MLKIYQNNLSAKMNKNYSKAKKINKRKIGTLNTRPFILIVCEGTRTEPNYFRSFEIFTNDVIDLDVEGLGKHTLDLVEKADLIKKKNEKNKGINYSIVWVVFDKDSFSDEEFNLAIDKAKNKSFKVAYSNECFEIWYFLHFYFCDSSIDRHNLFRKIDDIFHKEYKCSYEKNAENIYNLIIEKQDFAIKNAKCLFDYFNSNKISPAKSNPSTTVFLLVKELNEYKKNNVL